MRWTVVPGQAAVVGVVTVGTLLASDILGSDRFAGLGSAAFTLGAAVWSVPLAANMRRHGRRPVLTAALLAGAVGALIAATGGQLRWFPLYLIGMACFGAGQSATLQTRYAATDLALPTERAAAIGAIVWIGTIGAVVGPNLTPWERDVGEWLGLDDYIGPFLFAALLFAIGAAICFVRLRPDPLVVSGQLDPHAERTRPIRQVRASIGTIVASPLALLGLAAMAISQATMVAVMTMTPPHMDDHGHDDLSALVIAAHVLGMYALAPLVGRFVDRVGAVLAVRLGAVVLAIGCGVSVIAGYVPALMFVGLFLLGLGWNVGLIAGTTLLTSYVPDHARVEAQGTGDLTMAGLGAVGAFGSGLIKTGWSFHVLANVAVLLGAALALYATVVGLRVRSAR